MRLSSLRLRLRLSNNACDLIDNLRRVAQGRLPRSIFDLYDGSAEGQAHDQL